jgi:hypothetical protein
MSVVYRTVGGTGSKALTVGLGQVRIFQDLGEEEALLDVVIAASPGNIDILQPRVSRSNARGGVDRNKGIPGPISVLLGVSGTITRLEEAMSSYRMVASDTVRIIIAFHDLGPQHIVAARDIEAVLLEERGLV